MSVEDAIVPSKTRAQASATGSIGLYDFQVATGLPGLVFAKSVQRPHGVYAFHISGSDFVLFFISTQILILNNKKTTKCKHAN